MGAFSVFPEWATLGRNKFSVVRDVALALDSTAALLLAVGGILLLSRLVAGRVMVIIGAVELLLAFVIELRVAYDNFGLIFIAALVLGLLLGLPALVLAAVPATGRWIQARHHRWAA
ncbi:hypothetical protein [Nocardia terpenica]|uniref:hypothetical protein n=1 Tax=Nocardia terpenica TaxID=455432 RepID=UPI001E3D9C44|nr:hypothetical protein [Nocardia terpenica]MBF6152671.1 hypothetical protein [Nocardia terpenica]